MSLHSQTREPAASAHTSRTSRSEARKAPPPKSAGKAGFSGPLAGAVAKTIARRGPHTEESIIERLEEAGATLLCLPTSGTRNDLRTSRWPVIHAAIDAYGWSGARLRPAAPAAADITRMDEALGWIGLIPQESYVLRRIVGARALVSPLTGRHLFTWRRLGTLLGADARAVRRWHAKGIAAILDGLNAGARC